MIRPFRLFATLAATLALALGVTTRLVRAEPEAPPPAVAYKGAVPVHARAGDSGEYQLERLPILSRVILQVKDNYVEPGRIDPKQMVVSALEAVEKTVAEVMVQGDARSQKLVLTAGSAQRDLDISGVKSIWEVRTVLGEAMGFIQQHLVAHEDVREIEYAAVNGLLQTLDPHSVLFDPKSFKEMKLQTRGEFGGLGFVVAMRDGNLTVVRVLKNTPAQRAGVRAKDVITKIEEQSTVEMDLQDAVDRLRGRPGTKVVLSTQRAGLPEPRRLHLTREVISIETVPTASLLQGSKIGYIRLTQFSGNSTRDLVQAVQQQKAAAGGKLQGLVLDLRGNPGGLLDQAIAVSDLFLSEGVIVKTVGEGDKQQIHEVKEASADSSDLTGLPMVVVVNNSSASASEIVAGALKNNGRALVIGRQTFGKGSVQVLYDFSDPGRPAEEAALKLTIAQYLTPGDVSIQEVGITPDVLLLPGRALKEQVNVFAPPRSMGEADLDHHFVNPADRGAQEAARAEAAKKRRVEKAPLELRYLLDEKEDLVAKQLRKDAAAAAAAAHADAELTPEQQEDEDADANPDEFVEDYQIRFAKELLERAPYPDRNRQLEAARALVAQRKEQEEDRLEKRLKELGVDWAEGPVGAHPRAVVTVSPPPGRELRAGETLPWTVTVDNRGEGPFRRLRAWTTAEKNPLLDRREFVFGTVRAGERRTWTVPVKLPPGMDTRRDEVILHFADDAGKAPPDVTTAVAVSEQPKPAFAFSVSVNDAKGGNGDGLPQRGETFELRVDVRNAGTGAAGDKTYVAVKNLGDEKLFIKKGREVIGALKPGEVKSATMEVELRRGSKSDTLPIRVVIADEKMQEVAVEKLDLTVAKDEPARTAAKGAVRVDGAEALLRVGASASSPAIASAHKGAVLPFDARVGEFYRVEWQRGRFAFVADADVKPARGGARAGVVAPLWQREPPRIALAPDPARGAPVVEGDTFKLQGSASVPVSADPTAKLRDVFVFVNDQKVFFKVQPENAAAAKMDFTAEIPLKPGNNQVTVVAREDDEFQTRRSVVVFRRGPAEVAAEAGRSATSRAPSSRAPRRQARSRPRPPPAAGASPSPGAKGSRLPPAARRGRRASGGRPVHSARMAEPRQTASASGAAGARGGTGFELRLERGVAAVRLAERELAPGLLVESLTLRLPDVEFPFDVGQGAVQFRHRLADLTELRVTITPAAVEGALARADLSALGVEQVQVAFRDGFAEVAGRLAGGPAFTLEAALVPRGEQGLAVVFHSPLLHGPAPIAAAALPHLAARALPAAGAPPLPDGPLPALLRAVLVPRAWKLPRSGGVPLARAELAEGVVRLAWDRGAGSPAPLTAAPALLAAEEGARAFPAVEAALARGDVAGARDALLAAGPAAAAHPFGAERLLSLLVLDDRFHDEALDLAADWLARRPGFAPALAAEAQVRLARGEEGRAAAAFATLAEGAAARGAHSAALAAAEAAFGLPGAARADALRAVELALGLRRDHVPALRALAALAAAADDREALLRADRRLVAYDPDPAQRARAHAELGELLLEADPPAARHHLDQALRLAPEEPVPLGALWRACAAAGEPLRAVRVLDQLRDVHLARGARAAAAAAALEAGKLLEGPLAQGENALLRYRAAAELHPSAEAHAHAARVAEALGHWAEAADHQVELLAALDPAAPGAAALAARTRAALADVAEHRLGDPAAAAAHLEAAAALAPDDAGLLSRLTALQRRLGRTGPLAATLERLAALAPEGERAALLAEAGEALLGLGRADEAAGRLEAALADDDRCRAALEGLARLAAAGGDAAGERDALVRLLPLAADAADAAGLQDRLSAACERAGNPAAALAAATAAREACETPARLGAELRLARGAADAGALAGALARGLPRATGAEAVALRLELSGLLEARGEGAEAARLAEEALALDPGSLAALRALVAPAREGELGPARRAELLGRLAAHPEVAAEEAGAALAGRARLLAAAGEVEAALAAARDAAARGIEDDAALELRAALAGRAGAPAEAAAALLERAHRARDRGEADAGDRLAEAGLAALPCGLPGAEPALRDALALAPGPDVARSALLALAELARGRGEDAAEAEALAALVPLLPTGARPAALLRRAALALAAGEARTAREAADEARRLAPRDAAAVEASRAAAEVEGDLAAVAERLEELALLSPDGAAARRLERARLLSGLDRADEADRAYAAALRDLPPDRALADEHARLRRERLPARSASEPIERYALRVEDPAEAARALRVASAIALSQGDRGAALRAARRAFARTQAAPGYVGPLLARILYLGGSADEALVLHRRLLEMGLDLLEADDALTVARQLAELAEDQGEVELARAALGEVLSRRPQDLEAALRRFALEDDPRRAARELAEAAEGCASRRLRAEALGRAGEAALSEGGDPALAEDLLRRALEAAGPASALAPALARRRAEALRAAGGDAAPGLAEALALAAELSRAAGDAGAARALLADAAALDRAGGRGLQAAGHLLQLEGLTAAAGDLAAAAGHAREAGALLLDANDLDGAASALRRALAGDPADVEAARLLEQVARALGPAAAPLLLEALGALAAQAGSPEERAEALVDLAAAEAADGDPGAAETTLRAALAEVPGHRAAAQRLRALRGEDDGGAAEPDDAAEPELAVPDAPLDGGPLERPDRAERAAVAAEPGVDAPSGGDAPGPAATDPRDLARAAIERGVAAADPAERARAFAAAAEALATGGGDADELHGLLDAACEADPDAAEPWRARARIETTLGDPLAAARALLAVALRTEGDEAAGAALEAARLFDAADRPDDALRACRAAVLARPGCTPARMRLAEAALAAGDGEVALRHLEAVSTDALSTEERGAHDRLRARALEAAAAPAPKAPAAPAAPAATPTAPATPTTPTAPATPTTPTAATTPAAPAEAVAEAPGSAPEEDAGTPGPTPAGAAEVEAAGPRRAETVEPPRPATSESAEAWPVYAETVESPWPEPAEDLDDLWPADAAPQGAGQGAGLSPATDLAARGRAHLAEGDLPRAYARLREALAIDPCDLSVVRDLCQVAESLGRAEEEVNLGEICADAIAPYDPLAASARFRRFAALLGGLGQPGRAEVMLRKALALVPGDPETHRALLTAWGERDASAPRALSGWLEVARRDPADAAALAEVAALCRRLAGAPGASAERLAERGRLVESLAAFADPARPAPPPARVAARVPPELRERLAAPGATGATARLLSILSPWLEPLFPADPARLGAGPADRLAAEAAPGLHAALDAAARALGVRPHAIYLTARPGREIALENTRPPSVVLSRGTAALPAGSLPFVAARTLDLLQHGGALVGKFAPRDLGILLELACRFAGGAPPPLGLPAERAGAFIGALVATVPPDVRARAAALAAAASAELRSLDPRALAASLRRTANRVALLHAGDPGAALGALALLDRRLDDGPPDPAQALALPDLRDLAVLALSDGFLELRRSVLG